MLPELNEEQVRHRIARRIALDLEDGSFVKEGTTLVTIAVSLSVSAAVWAMK